MPHNRVAELGETVRFQCAVAGHPQPWARWDKDGAACTATARLTVSERDDVRTLEVRQVTLEDAGLYRVVIENDYGRVEATARLEVIGKDLAQHELVQAPLSKAVINYSKSRSKSAARMAWLGAVVRRPALAMHVADRHAPDRRHIKSSFEGNETKTRC